MVEFNRIKFEKDINDIAETPWMADCLAVKVSDIIQLLDKYCSTDTEANGVDDDGNLLKMSINCGSTDKNLGTKLKEAYRKGYTNGYIDHKNGLESQLMKNETPATSDLPDDCSNCSDYGHDCYTCSGEKSCSEAKKEEK